MKRFIRKAYDLIGKYLDLRKEYIYYKAKNEPAHQYLSLNPMPELTIEQREMIDSYWRQYGIKFNDYSWFRWFGGISGEVDPRYIPNDIYAYIIWPYYNNESFCEAYKDKNFFEQIMPAIRFPRVVMKRINGRYYDSENKFYDCKDEKALVSLLMTVKEAIVKDAWDSGEGRGVKKYIIENEADAKKILNEWQSDNFLVQEVIHQNKCFAQFNESSVNIMRITSWYHDGKVEILAPSLRVGTAGYVTDVAYIDGVEVANVIGITEEGYFKPILYSQDGKKTEIDKYVDNPKCRIPCWDEIITIIKENHPRLSHFDLVGWDFTVTDNNEVVCIEYNIRRPGTVFYQYTSGPFFGVHTEDVLGFLKDKDNQEKYIPKWLKC